MLQQPSIRSQQDDVRRDDLLREGASALAQWIEDAVSSGLGHLDAQPPDHWNLIIARLMDCKLPALAARLKQIDECVRAAAPGWEDRQLEHLSRLHLLAEALLHLDSHPPDLRADLEALVGWQPEAAEIEALPVVADTWLLLGRQVRSVSPSFQFGSLSRNYRWWFYGLHTGRFAMVSQLPREIALPSANQFPQLQYMPFGTQLGIPQPMRLQRQGMGWCFEAEVSFLPSVYPYRALIRRAIPGAPSPVPPLELLPTGDSLPNVLDDYSTALGKNLWLEFYIMVLSAVLPVYHQGRWVIQDVHSGQVLPLRSAFKGVWTMLSATGGLPTQCIGEWDGETLALMCAWTKNLYLPLDSE